MWTWHRFSHPYHQPAISLGGVHGEQGPPKLFTGNVFSTHGRTTQTNVMIMYLCLYCELPLLSLGVLLG